MSVRTSPQEVVALRRELAIERARLAQLERGAQLREQMRVTMRPASVASDGGLRSVVERAVAGSTATATEPKRTPPGPRAHGVAVKSKRGWDYWMQWNEQARPQVQGVLALLGAGFADFRSVEYHRGKRTASVQNVPPNRRSSTLNERTEQQFVAVLVILDSGSIFTRWEQIFDKKCCRKMGSKPMLVNF